MHVSGTSAAFATALAAAAIVAPGAGAHGHRGGGHGDQGDSPGYMNARLPVEARVRDLLSRMTLAEKIGQMTQAERANVDANTATITKDNLGSVLSGGG